MSQPSSTATESAWSTSLDTHELKSMSTQELTTTFHSPLYLELQSKKQQQQQQQTSNNKTHSNHVPYLTDSQQQSTNLSLSIQKKIVIDSGAIIHSAKLEKYGSEFYTTPLVLTEIKSSKSKQKLLLFPFEIKVRNPSSDALSVICRYAQKTGDYASLSKTDLSVLALAYELELETNGEVNIRPEPESLGIEGFKKVPLTPYTELFGHGKHHDDGEEVNDDDEYSDEEEGENGGNEENEENGEDDGWETPKKVVKTIRKGADGVKLNSNNDQNGENGENDGDDGEYEVNSDDEYEDNEEEGGEWITTNNIDKHKNRGLEGNDELWDESPLVTVAATSDEQVENNGDVNDNKQSTTEATAATSDKNTVVVDHRKVGCLTTDFSMQNVLLHMGLNLVSVDGRRIRHLTRFVNRCYACDTLVPDQTRIFCPNCGNDTLKKVSCIINDKGEAKFYYNPKRRINLRGSKYVIPMPKGGRNARDPILREDQLNMFKQGKPHKAKLTLSKTGSAHIESFNGDVWQPEYSFEASFTGGSHKGRPYERFNRAYNGYGRRNPNESIKTGSKKKKSNR